MAASYNLQSDIQCESDNVYFAIIVVHFCLVFIQVQSDQEAALFSSQCSTLVALSKGCKSVIVVRDQGDDTVEKCELSISKHI